MDQEVWSLLTEMLLMKHFSLLSGKIMTKYYHVGVNHQLLPLWEAPLEMIIVVHL